MKQPPGYVAQGGQVCLKKAIYRLKQSSRAWFEKFSLTISVIGFHRCHSDHSDFIRRTKSGIVVLIVYVNILLTGIDSARLLKTKQYLKRHFVTKDMRRLKYFLRIEVAHQKHSLLLFQRKNAQDLLEEAVFWNASLLLLQWKPTWIHDLKTVMHLIQKDIED